VKILESKQKGKFLTLYMGISDGHGRQYKNTDGNSHFTIALMLSNYDASATT
jgi:hypothetical protein